MRINIEQIRQTNNLIDYAQSFSELRKVGPTEYAGPCPVCNDGDDRFHVSADWWFCRYCHPKRGDIIEFARLVNRWGFKQACENLVNGNLPTVNEPLSPKPKPTPTPQPQEKRKEMAEKAHYFLSALGSSNGAPGRDYLTSRSIAVETAKRFKLGYSKKRNAIAIPWLDQNDNITAIRYRHINPELNQPKIVSEKGSRFSSLHGYHTHSGSVDQRTLIVCEGELNVISIYQTTQETNVDVLSVGSESTRIKDDEIETIRQWRTCILWTDKQSIWQRIAPSFKFDRYIESVNGVDANDRLKNGTLSAFVAAHRRIACNGNREALQRLLEDYRDVNIDNTTAELMVDIESEINSV